jgi:drug/metabolite transporter (DMT)-like permease
MDRGVGPTAGLALAGVGVVWRVVMVVRVIVVRVLVAEGVLMIEDLPKVILIDPADLDLALVVLGVGVQDQGANITADIEDRVLEGETRWAGGLGHRSNLLVGGYALTGVRVHRLQPVGPAAGSTGGGDDQRMAANERAATATTQATAAVTRSRFPWQVAFLVLASIWGCSFYFIKLGLVGLNPIQVAFARLSIGAITLVILATLSRTRLPRSASTWRRLFVMAVLMNVIPFVLFSYGETQVSSILAGIINGATPLATLAAVLVAFPEEDPTPSRVAGLLIGFVGVLVVVGIWKGLGTGELPGVLACIGAICCYGVSFPYGRRHLIGLVDGPISLATGQILAATLLMLPLVALSGGPPGPITSGVVFGMLGLGALGTGIAYVLNYRIVAAAGGTTASTVTYLTPLVAILVGVAFLNEPLAWNEPIGGLIVALGVAVAQGRLRGLVRRYRAGSQAPPAGDQAPGAR